MDPLGGGTQGPRDPGCIGVAWVVGNACVCVCVVCCVVLCVAGSRVWVLESGWFPLLISGQPFRRAAHIFFSFSRQKFHFFLLIAGPSR